MVLFYLKSTRKSLIVLTFPSLLSIFLITFYSSCLKIRIGTFINDPVPPEWPVLIELGIVYMIMSSILSLKRHGICSNSHTSCCL